MHVNSWTRLPRFSRAKLLTIIVFLNGEEPGDEATYIVTHMLKISNIMLEQEPNQ